MRRLVIGLVTLLSAVTVGLAPTQATASTIPVGHSTQRITVAGMVRTFHLYRPAGISGPAPLVVMLHGGYGDGEQAEKSYGWDAAADSGHFIAVFPDGYDKSWNAGGTCCGQAEAQDVDDVAFIRALVRTVRDEAAIDPARIYVAGMSNGAIMAYRLACETHLFDAVASVAGTILVNCTHAAPASVIEIHGTADHNVPYDGGPGQPYSSRSTPIDGPSVPANNRTWRRNDSCPAPRTTTDAPVTTSLARCPGGRAVELISISGAGHQWPDSVSRPGVQRLLHTDPPSTALNATTTIWRFFAAHPGT
jgi:polyhydroxybutyrate depolymerase